MKFNNLIMAPEKHYLGLFSFFSAFPYQIAVDFSWWLRKLVLASYFQYLEYAGHCEICYREFHISNAV